MYKNLGKFRTSTGKPMRVLWLPKKEIAKKFIELRNECFTAFYLPHRIDTLQGRDSTSDALNKLPFDCFALIERFTIPQNTISPDNKFTSKNETNGIEESVLKKLADGDGDFTYITKIKYNHNNDVIYQPEAENYETNSTFHFPYMFFNFYDLLMKRKIRFLEQPVSRQVRRAGNYHTEYREYIIISRDDIRYPNAIPANIMLRRMRMLHAVRGHDRNGHWRTSKYGVLQWVSPTFVHPHSRGEGELFQVKDYIIERLVR